MSYRAALRVKCMQVCMYASMYVCMYVWRVSVVHSGGPMSLWECVDMDM
jgi:hypothetical protein